MISVAEIMKYYTGMRRNECSEAITVILNKFIGDPAP